MFGRKPKPVAQTEAEKDAQALAALLGSTQAMIAQFNTNSK